MALVLAFLSAENENQQLEDLPFNWKTSSVGKDKVTKWEFCNLKITTIVVFVIMIQRIFPSKELTPTHHYIWLSTIRLNEQYDWAVADPNTKLVLHTNET